MSGGQPILTNLKWRIGPCIIIDVSTKLHLRRSAIINAADETAVLGEAGRWFAYASTSGVLYAGRSKRIGKRCKITSMHLRVAQGIDDGLVRDHKNGDGLDNRMGNLRPATNKQNFQNARIRDDGTSRFRGVSWDSETSKWTAAIGVDGKTIKVGRHRSEVEAARVYNQIAVKHFGEFARLNQGI